MQTAELALQVKVVAAVGAAAIEIHEQWIVREAVVIAARRILPLLQRRLRGPQPISDVTFDGRVKQVVIAQQPKLAIVADTQRRATPRQALRARRQVVPR